MTQLDSIQKQIRDMEYKLQEDQRNRLCLIHDMIDNLQKDVTTIKRHLHEGSNSFW